MESQTFSEALMKRNMIVMGTLVVLTVIIILYGILSETHKDVTSYITIVAPMLPALLGLLIVSNQAKQISDKVDDAATKVAKVEDQTNGKLDTRFNELKTHIE